MAHMAYLSLGSNQGDARANLRAAIAAIAQLGTIDAESSFYRTEPVDFTAQPWFFNCAVALRTDKTPHELMAALLHIEDRMGRRRNSAPDLKGPRIIDIDIVLYDEFAIDAGGLSIPHPRMHQRRFVLEPLAEIAAQVRHPELGETIARLLQDLKREGQATVRDDGS